MFIELVLATLLIVWCHPWSKQGACKRYIAARDGTQQLVVHSSPFPFSDTDGTDNNNTMAYHQQVRRRHPRTFRECKKILGIYDDAELIKRYQLDSEGLLLLLIWWDKLHSCTEWNYVVTPEMKVLVTLISSNWKNAVMLW